MTMLASMLLIMPLVVLVPWIPYLLRGKTTPGRVLDRTPIACRAEPPVLLAVTLGHGGGRRRGVTCSIRYEFTDNAGQLRQGSHPVGHALWSRVQPNAPITIVYDSSNPTRSRPLENFDWGQSPAIVFGIAGLILLACAIRNTGYVIRETARAVRLIRNGCVAPIEILDDQIDQARGEIFGRTITFRYRARRILAGPLEDFTATDRSHAVGQTTSSLARDLIVIFDPQSPEDCLIDWFCLASPRPAVPPLGNA